MSLERWKALTGTAVRVPHAESTTVLFSDGEDRTPPLCQFGRVLARLSV